MSKQRIPVSILFGGPPGIDSRLTVDNELGDIVVRLDLAGRPFCELVLTLDDAIIMSTMLCSSVMNEKRRREGLSNGN